ncbi:MAG: class I SAM-dependent methyltransferase [Myxococcota bacterium]
MSRALVRRVTCVREATACPELRLRVADEPLSPWQETEVATGEVQPPPFWAHAWPGGLALARFVLDEPALVRGRSVLDFASGGGVSAVAAARAGAARVLATEVDAFAVAAIEENAALNGVQLDVTGDDVIGRDEGWDVVLVGDVFYEDELSRRVEAWLRVLHRRGAEIRIGDPGRSFLPVKALECVATCSFPAVPAWDSVLDRPARVWAFREPR